MFVRGLCLELFCSNYSHTLLLRDLTLSRSLTLSLLPVFDWQCPSSSLSPPLPQRESVRARERARVRSRSLTCSQLQTQEVFAFFVNNSLFLYSICEPVLVFLQTSFSALSRGSSVSPGTSPTLFATTATATTIGVFIVCCCYQ